MNRAANLQRLCQSLAQMTPGVPFELVVADFGSTDANLTEMLAAADIRTVLTKVDSEFFNRSKGLNIAANEAHYNLLFFIDVDMLVPKDFLVRIVDKVKDGECWFPICYSLHKGKPAIMKESSRNAAISNGWWRTEGAGNAGFTRADFNKLGRWDEQIGKSYGREDGDLCRRAGDRLFRHRDKCPNFFHVWHSTSPKFRESYHQVQRSVLVRAVPKVAPTKAKPPTKSKPKPKPRPKPQPRPAKRR